jgi:DNA-binding NtrC family response regulator
VDKTKTNNTSPSANVLVVDNDQQTTGLLLKIFAQKGIYRTIVSDRKSLSNFLDNNTYNMAFGNINIDRPENGFKLLREIRQNSPEMPVIMIANSNQKTIDQQRIIDTAVKAANSGCSDFLIKPLDYRKIENILGNFLPRHCVSTAHYDQKGSHSEFAMVVKSAKLINTIKLAKKIAPTSAPVMVNGESGTGKELISYIIHHSSKRSDGPYIRVNCAALTDSLLESELFGHEKGAFTGAHAQRKGRFEMAHGGTLLLDEITETPLKFQAKLLRVLEQQDFERVGGNDRVRVNVRIICTSNRDLMREISEGRFRQDLYYRLSGVRLIVPPLRERQDDLPDLVWHFVNLYAQQAQRIITKLDPVMINVFSKYNWPGNIRQLRNVVMTSLIFGSGSMLSLADVSWLFDEIEPATQDNQLGEINFGSELSSLAGIPLQQVEKQAILETLEHTEGNQTKAAKILGISDRTLRGKIRRYREENNLQLI